MTDARSVSHLMFSLMFGLSDHTFCRRFDIEFSMKSSCVQLLVALRTDACPGSVRVVFVLLDVLVTDPFLAGLLWWHHLSFSSIGLMDLLVFSDIFRAHF